MLAGERVLGLAHLLCLTGDRLGSTLQCLSFGPFGPDSSWSTLCLFSVTFLLGAGPASVLGGFGHHSGRVREEDHLNTGVCGLARAALGEPHL